MQDAMHFDYLVTNKIACETFPDELPIRELRTSATETRALTADILLLITEIAGLSLQSIGRKSSQIIRLSEMTCHQGKMTVVFGFLRSWVLFGSHGKEETKRSKKAESGGLSTWASKSSFACETEIQAHKHIQVNIEDRSKAIHFMKS
ncbi:hypothetical protein M9H77_21806 [Catharanthus roseus]|uniref:Uncharacterized protein n=1 Tax=Catharanthus roseus TaxID=4058 RepID=A0ACC0ASR7_CATRO|nr:hypothetical protein M9H77_21806 [Catharanthus roseus]